MGRALTVAVEEVRRADQRRRFHELGRVLFASEPRWAPPVVAYERWLFDRRHPYRRDADLTRFLVRRRGQVVGRVCAHKRSDSDDGWFGAFECGDDERAVVALVGAARDWLAEHGATSITGPATFTPADEAGVLLAGFEHPGGTGRPWHPPWYEAHLGTAGLKSGEHTVRRWRLDANPVGYELEAGGPLPPQAGRFADARIVLAGPPGAIAAVPDVAPSLRTHSLRGFRQQLATVEEVAVVRCEGDPTVLVPALLRAAAEAGYRTVWAPWSPVDRPPDLEYRLLTAPF